MIYDNLYLYMIIIINNNILYNINNVVLRDGMR